MKTGSGQPVHMSEPPPPAARRKPGGDPRDILQMPLPVGKQLVTNSFNRSAIPDGRQGIVEGLPTAVVVTNITSSHQRQPRLPPQRSIERQSFLVVTLAGHFRQPDKTIAQPFLPAANGLNRHVMPTKQPRQRQASQQPFGMGSHLIGRQPAATFNTLRRHRAAVTVRPR